MRNQLLLFFIALFLTAEAMAAATYPVCPAPTSIPSGCAQALPFCTGTTYTFPNTTGTGDQGALECLLTTPNPTWYYLEIATAGNIDIQINQTNTSGTGIDVDFALLGPYSSVPAACSNPGSACVEDCSYSTAASETANIVGAQVGEVYLLLLTNFANQAGTITFNQSGGSGATDCSIIAPSCQITALSATPSGCTGNTYSVSGQIQFNDPPGAGTLTVSGSCGGSQTFNAPFTSPLNYSFAGLTPNGSSCTVTATFSNDATCTLTQNYTAPAIPVVGAGGDQTVCSGSQITLSGSGASTYSWSDGVSNGVAFTPPAGSTLYTVTGTNAAGCTATDQVQVNVNNNPVVNAGTYPAVCSSVGSVALSGTPVGGTFSGTGVTGSTFNTASGTQVITYNYTDGNNCSGTATTTITVNPSPIANAGPDVVLCENGSTTINASGAGTPSWSPAPGLSSTSILNPVAGPSSTTTYTLTLNDNGCTDSDDVIVTVVQNPDLVVTNDLAICEGDCATISVSGADFYAWSPSADITDPTAASQNVCPAVTTTYDVTGYVISGNTVANGDFSGGSTGFSSDYILNSDTQSEGTYFVTTNANLTHPGFVGNDHTTGSGNFMVVNGSGTPNSTVWCQTMSVQPNMDYVFSTWVSTLALGSPAILQFSINGTNLGTPFNAPANTNQWDEFYTTWNSGASTSATICIVNQNTSTGGNDFGLDDIFFSAVCSSTESVTVTVNTVPTVDDPADQTLCGNTQTNAVNFSGNNASTTYNWTNDNTSIGLSANGSGNIPAFNALNSGNTPVTGTVTVTPILGSCTGTPQSFTITVDPVPTVTDPANQVLCDGQNSAPVVFSGNSAGTVYNWSNSNTSIGLAASGTGDIPSFTGVNSGSTPQVATITVTPVLGACTGAAQTFSITVNPLPNISAGADITICEGQEATLSGANGVSYSWNNGVVNGQSFVPASSGTYTVTGTDANGCVNTDDVTITLLPPPTSAFTADSLTGYPGLNVNFTNDSQDANSYLWVFGNGQLSSVSTMAGQNATYGSPGTYTVYLIADNGYCTDSSSLEIVVIPFPDPIIHVPNVFTPNGDGTNDHFFIATQYVETLEISIFNRWGNLMREVNGINDHWDGTVNGKDAEEGTYFFKYYVKGINGTELTGHGNVTLNR